MIHTGSRGLGRQVCSDYVHEMLQALPEHRIQLPNPQLAAAPLGAAQGRWYLAAMAAAANYRRANRQVIAWGVRREFEAVFGDRDISVVYDVSHNLAKMENRKTRPREYWSDAGQCPGERGCMARVRRHSLCALAVR